MREKRASLNFLAESLVLIKDDSPTPLNLLGEGEFQ